ncbi:RDD family protein [Pedobacter nototheniae]|uniref:hypothetical protein n=1 Tax=Pedobacter nototheniae TaxID=2488994 RepID=UPI00103A2886|nr:hypothetical protein [Pedobacter nototheniae]
MNKSQPKYITANKFERLRNLIIDFVFSLCTATLTIYFSAGLYTQILGKPLNLGIWPFILLTLCLLATNDFIGLYFFKTALSHRFNQTLVLSYELQRPKIHQLIVRAALRAVPLDWIHLLFFKKSLHDRLSKTIVVREKLKALKEETIQLPSNSLALLKAYNRSGHVAYLYPEGQMQNVLPKPIYTAGWENSPDTAPVIVLSGLIDSYYCLPERPDLAFSNIWTAINNSYTATRVQTLLDAGDFTHQTGDANSIDDFIDKLVPLKDNLILPGKTIYQLIQDYAALAPDKTLRFIANIVLKGYIIDDPSFPRALKSQTYFTFKNKFEDIYNGIIASYGTAYRSICQPAISNYKINLNINNVVKSKSIPRSLAEKLRTLLTSGTVNVTEPGLGSAHTLIFTGEQQYINFVFRNMLYATRNNNFHGNVVQRLNSEYKNGDSVKASIYIYYLAHMFLSLTLYVNGDILLDDLKVNIDNLNKLRLLL